VKQISTSSSLVDKKTCSALYCKIYLLLFNGWLSQNDSINGYAILILTWDRL